ncbi:hypothetical protein SAMN05421736_12813 [Evansella caseinilytica]|uniref:YwdI family protein n=1 Tax=Evansella caseinilytica TaxID=1503961 RepID=A0A1H3UWL1_9BACI|nr:DUF5327 family protein [Evansella caseinilytica]SDZ66832.1 hypothetical protein SAMN05421736_12813 [Evansella caseinilytica]
MNIPAKTVIAKMEEEVAKLKKTVEETPDTEGYREPAAAIKAYCDLLLSSGADAGAGRGKRPTTVKYAAVEDVMGQTKPKETLSPYDDDEDRESDSLLDF